MPFTVWTVLLPTLSGHSDLRSSPRTKDSPAASTEPTRPQYMRTVTALSPVPRLTRHTPSSCPDATLFASTPPLLKVNSVPVAGHLNSAVCAEATAENDWVATKAVAMKNFIGMRPWLGFLLLAERGEDFLDGFHLVARRRGGHEDWRVHARRAPGGDAVAHFRRRAEQRGVGQPFVGEIFRHVVAAALGDRLFDRLHLLDVARFLPVIPVVRQERVVGERAPVHRLGGLDVVADAGRDHVADEEIGIAAPGCRQRRQRRPHLR